MEHSLVAPFDGIVAELEAREGAQVSERTLLVRIEKGEGPDIRAARPEPVEGPFRFSIEKKGRASTGSARRFLSLRED